MSPRPFARIAGVLTLALTALLLARLIQVDNLVAWPILVAPFASGVLSLAFPASPGAVTLAAIVLFAGALPMLLGGYGVMYLPSVGLLLAQAVSPTRRNGEAVGPAA